MMHASKQISRITINPLSPGASGFPGLYIAVGGFIAGMDLNNDGRVDWQELMRGQYVPMQYQVRDP